MKKLLALGAAMRLALGGAPANGYAKGGGGQGRGGSQVQSRARSDMAQQSGTMQQKQFQHRYRYGQSRGGMGGMQPGMGTCPYYLQCGTGGL